MDSAQFRQAAHSSLDEIIQYYDTIEERRVVSDVKPGYLRPLLPSCAPEQGEPWAAIQRDIEAKIQPGLTHWASPNFMAFFPAASTYPAMLGELWSAAFNTPAFNWICAPAITELETIVLDWLAQALALPPCFLSRGSGGGVIQGSASEAIVTCMVAARERFLTRELRRRGVAEGVEGEARDDAVADLRGRLVALGSEQSHSSTQKGARIAGVRYVAIKARLCDDLSLTGEGVRDALAACRKKGWLPFYLGVNLGTTPTCAVDRFEEIAQVLQEAEANHDIWTHVDAAYAGAALVCPEHQHLAAALAAFDSFEVNMHKWLLTNFDAGCLFVRRRRDLTDALTVTPSYLRSDVSERGLVTDYRDWQIPLGRRFRSLKIWFVMRTYGLAGLRAHVRDHIRLGDVFAGWVAARPDLFRIVARPRFALTVLAVVPEKRLRANGAAREDGPEDGPADEGVVEGTGGDDGMPEVRSGELEEANRLTEEVYELINRRGEIYLTSGVVEGVYAIRVVSANPKAAEKNLRRAFEILVETATEVMARGK